MNIFLYWNKIDSDSKKIYKFIKDPEFRNALQSNNNVCFCEPFSRAFKVDQVILKEIEKSDLVMFFTHGEEDTILKATYNFDEEKKIFSFVDTENDRILSQKRVIAICCDSAKVLGTHCVSDAVKSIFYIGFTDSIIYDDPEHTNVKSLVYDSYSNAFKESFMYSMSSKCTAFEFARFLRKSINDMITRKILCETDDRTLNLLSTITFHRQSANSLTALGNIDAIVF